MTATERTIRDRMHSILDTYRNLVVQIVQSLAAGNATATSDLMNRLIDKDRELSNTVIELKEHQEFQKKIIEAKNEIEEKDHQITNVMQILRSAETILSELVQEGKKQIKILDKSQSSMPAVEDIVSYSHRISGTTSAPPGWKGDTPLYMYKPPAPREDEMRSGLLYSKIADDIVNHFLQNSNKMG